MYEIDLLKEMLEIYSPSGQEAKLATLLREEMRYLGLKNVHIDPIGNVLGEAGSGKPKIILCGHMDTVPGFLEVREEDNALYGRGAVDAKSSLAAMIVAASRLNTKALGTITVIGVVDEEGDGSGIEHLLRTKLDADYFIFGEPSGVDKITVGYKGRIQFALKFKTAGGHASAPWASENAVERGYDLWNRIRNNLLVDDIDVADRFHEVSICLTVLKGGEFPNNIPENCCMTLDIRVPPQLACQKVVEELNRIVEAFKKEHPKVLIESKVEGLLDAYEADRNSLVVKGLRTAVFRVLGRNARLVRKTGTGDMNVIGLRQQIPVVTYGPGDSRLDHTQKERIDLDDYLNSIKIIETAAEYIANNH